MNSKPLVSSIIIFLNAEKFIEEAIASVFAQTYGNWELLLVDDGSSDGSTEVACRFAGLYPGKVRYLEHADHQNRGMSASRNLGISNAKGEYIAFLDSDDIWLPKKLEEQIAIVHALPEAAMIYGRTQIWYSWTGHPHDAQRDHFYELGVQADTLVKPPILLILLLRNKVQTPTTCNALLRRTVFGDIGRFHETFRGMYEDQVFFAKVCLRFPVFVAGECWARYRQHPDSCSSLAEKAGHNTSSRLALLDWLAEYLASQGVDAAAVWRALDEELWSCHHPLLARFRNPIYSITRRIKSKIEEAAN